jgi:hypothetical protein
VVALNLGEEEIEVDRVVGSTELSTTRALDGEPVTGRLRLMPHEGAVVRVG